MNKLIVILIIVLLQGCKDTNTPEINSIDNAEKVLLKAEGQDEFFYWELKDEVKLWEFESGKVEALQQYQDSLKLTLGSQRYKAAIEKEVARNVEKSLIGKEENGDRINALLIHTGSIGKIRKMNYLESQILNYQINRFPMLSHPTEFHGFISRNKKKEK